MEEMKDVFTCTVKHSAKPLSVTEEIYISLEEAGYYD